MRARMTLVQSSSATFRLCARRLGTAGTPREVVVSSSSRRPIFPHTRVQVQGRSQFNQEKESMTSLLRLKSTCCPVTIRVMLCLFALILLVGAQSASAQSFSGSIFTSFNDGATVNGNLYPSKDAVYLNGGPQ